MIETMRKAVAPLVMPPQPTIAELLADEVTQAVMEADGVDAKRLAADLRNIAGQIRDCPGAYRRPSNYRPRAESPTDDR
jgi:hypothetical protein